MVQWVYITHGIIFHRTRQHMMFVEVKLLYHWKHYHPDVSEFQLLSLMQVFLPTYLYGEFHLICKACVSLKGKVYFCPLLKIVWLGDIWPLATKIDPSCKRSILWFSAEPVVYLLKMCLKTSSGSIVCSSMLMAISILCIDGTGKNCESVSSTLLLSLCFPLIVWIVDVPVSVSFVLT